MSYDVEYDSIVNEFVDLTDRDTLSYVVKLDEAGQDQLLASLTDKLYNKIVEKVADIDFGTIPKSRGDITQIENFESMKECIDIIRGIVKQYSMSTEPIDQIDAAIQNVKERERLFSRCYVMNLELGELIYETTVLSIVSSVSLLIATSIDFIKSPTDETFEMSLDKVSYKKTTEAVLFNDIRKFNIACKKGQIDKTIEYITANRAKAMTGAVAAGVVGKVIVGGIIGAIAAKQILIPLAKNILPLLQSMVYFHYANQQSISDYFALQADLLQTNTANIEYRTDLTPQQKKKIIDKQLKVTEKLRKVSDKFRIKMKAAEVDSDRLAKSEYKRFQKEELETSEPANSLF